MAKKSDVTLLSPQRYVRNDPRNQARVNAGHLLSMQLGGYDYQIRKLLRSGPIRCVTLPPSVRNYLALENGDWLLFAKGSWPGVVTFTKLTNDERDCIAGLGGRDSLKLARKVQGRRCGVRVTVPPAVCKLLSAEVGDSLMFSRHSDPGVISMAVLKGGGDSAGSRRPG